MSSAWARRARSGSSSTSRTASVSVAAGQFAEIRRHVDAHVEPELGVLGQFDVLWIDRHLLAVDVADHLALLRSNLVGAERLVPDREEVTQREDAPCRRLDVHHAVVRVRME